MSTLTRDQVNDVMRRHNDHWPADTKFGPAEVRDYAKYLRAAADSPDANYDDNLIQAADLDALVDRTEQQAAA